MRCPKCFKDMTTREFYDHMAEHHMWTLAEAEKYADDAYLEKHGDPWGVLEKVKEWQVVNSYFPPKGKDMDELEKILTIKPNEVRRST